MDRTVTESIDDLVREAETLKVRLEEERAKFNDMECKSVVVDLFVVSSRVDLFSSDDRRGETGSLATLHHQITTYLKRSSRQSFGY